MNVLNSLTSAQGPKGLDKVSGASLDVGNLRRMGPVALTGIAPLAIPSAELASGCGRNDNTKVTVRRGRREIPSLPAPRAGFHFPQTLS